MDKSTKGGLKNKRNFHQMLSLPEKEDDTFMKKVSFSSDFPNPEKPICKDLDK
jgi:hypothetical protein